MSALIKVRRSLTFCWITMMWGRNLALSIHPSSCFFFLEQEYCLQSRLARVDMRDATTQDMEAMLAAFLCDSSPLLEAEQTKLSYWLQQHGMHLEALVLNVAKVTAEYRSLKGTLTTKCSSQQMVVEITSYIHGALLRLRDGVDISHVCNNLAGVPGTPLAE
jgi:hypothetical protein